MARKGVSKKEDELSSQNAMHFPTGSPAVTPILVMMASMEKRHVWAVERVVLDRYAQELSERWFA